MLKHLQQFATASIDALGGPIKVAELLGVDERVVSNWKQRGLPPDTYDAMAQLLKKIGRDAPPVMWRQRMILRKRVVRPPRNKPADTNGKALRR